MKTDFQPYINYTIFQSANGTFRVTPNSGVGSASYGNKTIEEACRAAQAHFGNQISHMGSS